MRPIRVLYVDGDEDFAELTADALAAQGPFEVHAEPGVEAALDALATADPPVDCVVTEYALPDGDGVELVERVGETDPDRPVVLFTGRGSDEVASAALAAGATDYVHKRGGTEQYELLAARLRDAVEAYRADRELERSERYRRELYRLTSDTAIDADERFRRLLELGCERFDVENGHIVRVDRDAGRHEVTMAVGSDLVTPGVSDLEETFCRATVDADDTIAVADATDEGWSEPHRRWGIGCYLGGRIEVGGELYGTLCFVDAEPRDRPVTHPERMFLDMLTRWVGNAIACRAGARRRRAFELAVDAVADGLFVVDADGEFALVNDALVDLTGRDRAELLGTPVGAVFDEAALAAADGWVDTTCRTVDGERGCAVRSRPLSPVDAEQFDAVVVVRAEDELPVDGV